ncbi:bifunctional glutamate--cysteine ligase GshA/glutathione synthetase GshB [Desulfotalea psychrophila]|uniref:Glutathione biosynthesis bifunctional protein GshAB n=1 Tax=Desulfotalea psychrophila (strain LSv54 / DSM 12343) TaxID=177439 RepID=GSHAB_DESPS|nr:bifunctional glutamate--cysteine ligase GshA/glutathione synthetase GshB [Desulfotalea psychrophila]Q6ANW2.1 RecName: Full=Glutathione biosynthesis bifunctional protein GshAB; AltName: Full=Gamma-GCS-GS; Short=GCS-GS; Includes: RecName: Full=Glutamate--cysteine ligase; AltName: Full=Gamma-ECS; Short=GCS; AltName: Full=Gamma-glutamylcysteine synthetase; Includes: RecName: Full=Glutathione synthetase; AltName: Full=GSH synthetase; Short=GS; Short=GSH-S; Short=GSHase; AltName: Full=Glutathione syn
MAFSKNILDSLPPLISKQIFEGFFGFEKENIRVDSRGKLALTPHPRELGEKTSHPYITTDFSESQIEIITPPLPSIAESLGFLETLHDLVSIELKDEYLWPQSAPPILPEREEDIPIAHFGGEFREQEEYRLQLAKIYGRKRQMFSGIHFNISLPERFLELLHEEGKQEQPFAEFREDIYMKTVRNFLRHRWFLICLLGASPVIHKSYRKHCIDMLSPFAKDAYHFPYATSIRNNICGYRNTQDFHLNYSTLTDYRESLQELVEKKVLRDIRENYAPIRIKTTTDPKRINHLEIRLLDLNPFFKTGVNPLHAEIIHIFLIYCLLCPEETSFTSKEQETANRNQEQAATEGLNPGAIICDADGNEQRLDKQLAHCLQEIQQTVSPHLPPEYRAGMEELERLVQNQASRPTDTLLKEIKQEGFTEWHMKQALKFLKKSHDEQFIFHGLRDMELSTQLLLRRAALRGVSFEIMDRQENFVCLEQAGKREYVMQASRTSLDNYISVLSMENKVITKKILDQAGINTPKGRSYSSPSEALADYPYYRGRAIVIKPKSTNFGIGITIIKENNRHDFFAQGIAQAFKHEATVLIENFSSGKEYRFFIVNDQVVGILHRVPANVTGDGTSSVQVLVTEKNKNPLRGRGYRTPLEKIKLEETEEMFLASQGYSFATVPAKDQRIYLRENSNISTGGDSIDFTDKVPQSYKDIAVRAAQALQVKITGLDMMIDSLEEDAAEDNFSIIELNFNPAIHIHCHPYIGKNRHLDDKILDALGFTGAEEAGEKA